MSSGYKKLTPRPIMTRCIKFVGWGWYFSGVYHEYRSRSIHLVRELGLRLVTNGILQDLLEFVMTVKGTSGGHQPRKWSWSLPQVNFPH